VIAQGYDLASYSCTGPVVTFDQNGNATGQMASLPTYSWLGYAYQDGPVDQVVSPALYLALGFWSFLGGNHSGNGTALNQQWYPPLTSCTDKGGNCQGPLGPRDLLWNARNDLVSQLAPNSACSNAAENNVFSKFTKGDIYGKPITRDTFVAYIQNNIGLYNGAKSTLPFYDALCPKDNPRQLSCQGDGLTIKGHFEDTSKPTAITISPSHPFKSFWQPIYTAPGPDEAGFGVGINPSGPGSSQYGVNIYNESILLHEALHGMTGLLDSEIATLLGPGAAGHGSEGISIYIKNNVLSACPSFTQGGH
jgi:hypothetical protein